MTTCERKSDFSAFCIMTLTFDNILFPMLDYAGVNVKLTTYNQQFVRKWFKFMHSMNLTFDLEIILIFCPHG